MTQSGETLSPSALRPEIRRSWERSLNCGLDRGSEIDLPYLAEAQGEDGFLRAAEPVLDQVSQSLDGSRTGVVLTDARGRLLLRRCSDRSNARSLDASQGTPGFRWSERYTGTTAISLAMEERLPALVVGGEHFLEALSHWVCAAAPVIHPISRRMQGVIDVTTDKTQASPHMMSVVMQAANAIQQRLYESSTQTERALLSQFLAASKRSENPLVVLGTKVELSTPAAARLLDVADRALLWEYAADSISTDRRRRRSVSLSSGVEIDALFTPIESDGRNVGAAIEIVSTGPAAAGRSSVGVARSASESSFVGRSALSRGLRQQVEALRREPVSVLITGEPGVGKLALARGLVGDGMECALFDAARIAVDGADALLREIAAIAETPAKTIIVRHVGCMSDASLQALAAIAPTAAAHSSRLVATMVTDAAGRPSEGSPDASSGHFGLRLEVPPLRERIDDIIDLVPFLIKRRAGVARFSPAVVQTLMRYDWPGNVGELDSLVRLLLASNPSGEVGIADLPADYRNGGRHLGRIERLERTAIARALVEAEGNKSRAASLLGIGRATLYRKIRAYGLDLDSTTG